MCKKLKGQRLLKGLTQNNYRVFPQALTILMPSDFEKNYIIDLTKIGLFPPNLLMTLAKVFTNQSKKYINFMYS